MTDPTTVLTGLVLGLLINAVHPPPYTQSYAPILWIIYYRLHINTACVLPLSGRLRWCGKDGTFLNKKRRRKTVFINKLMFLNY